jgi:predicted Fe-S protein YdhL (DUF1289 family)
VHLTRPPSQRHSPCVGVCKIDEDTGFCHGCARTRNEVAAWPSLSEAAQDAVWAKLPERLTLLSIRVGLLPWTVEEIAGWVAATIVDGRGTWATGVPGAVAEFPCREGREVSAELRHDVILGRASDALFRLRLHDRLRALTFRKDGPVVLGLPKGCVALRIARTWRFPFKPPALLGVIGLIRCLSVRTPIAALLGGRNSRFSA